MQIYISYPNWQANITDLLILYLYITIDILIVRNIKDAEKQKVKRDNHWYISSLFF